MKANAMKVKLLKMDLTSLRKNSLKVCLTFKEDFSKNQLFIDTNSQLCVRYFKK